MGSTLPPAHETRVQPATGDPVSSTTPALTRSFVPANIGGTLRARAAVQTRIAAPWLKTAAVSAPAAATAMAASKREKKACPLVAPGIRAPGAPAPQANT